MSRLFLVRLGLVSLGRFGKKELAIGYLLVIERLIKIRQKVYELSFHSKENLIQMLAVLDHLAGMKRGRPSTGPSWT